MTHIQPSQDGNKRPRRLKPLEYVRLTGFPDSFTIPVSDTQAYQQLGQASLISVINEFANIIIPHILLNTTTNQAD